MVDWSQIDSWATSTIAGVVVFFLLFWGSQKVLDEMWKRFKAALRKLSERFKAAFRDAQNLATVYELLERSKAAVREAQTLTTVDADDNLQLPTHTAPDGNDGELTARVTLSRRSAQRKANRSRLPLTEICHVPRCILILIYFFKNLFGYGASGCSVKATRDSVFKHPPKSVLDEVVYEIQPAPENPNIEIVFFHGFEVGDSKDAYWEDWLSGDGTHCWLGSWLVEEFPEARILTVRYDSSLTHTLNEGRVDLHRAARDLLSALTKFVGQHNCPIVLVGHSLGGLVMKKLMVEVNSKISGDPEDALKAFLSGVRGFFFYATPHQGSTSGPLLENLQILGIETSHLHVDFMDLCTKFKWKMAGLGELHESKLGPFSGIVVEEASAAHGIHETNFSMVDADHSTICKPEAKQSFSFHRLVLFINEILMITPQCTADSLPFTKDKKYVPFPETITKVRQALDRDTGQVVILYGASGDGKTSMAEYLALSYATACSTNPTKFGNDVYFLRCGPKGSGKAFTLLVQLWEDMGFGHPMLDGKSCWDASSSTDEQTLQCDRLRKDFKKKLEQKHVLIVLDNVWDTKLIQELLIPSKNIKYLVTTQRPNIWLDGGCEKIRIGKPSPEEAQQILMHHSGMSIGEVPQQLQPHFADIIKACDSCPLQLANVAVTIKHDKVLEELEWRTTKKDLKHRVDGVPQGGAVLFSRTYSSGTISNATSLAVNSFPKEAQTLLCIAAICDSPFDIPEIIVRMFYKVIHPKMTAFSLSCDDLVGSDFIKIDKNLWWEFELLKITWSIHEDRQSVIRNMENCKVEVEAIVQGILESEINTYEGESELLQALLFLYGQDMWQKKAAEKLGIVALITNNSMQVKGRIKAFTFLLDSNGEEESHSYVSKLIIQYVKNSTLDDQAMSKLCSMQGKAGVACAALRHFMYPLLQMPSCNNYKSTIGTCPLLVGALVALLDKDVDLLVQEAVLHALANLTLAAPDNKTMVVATPGALECLTKCLAIDGNPAIQQWTAVVIQSCSYFEGETRSKILSFPGLVEALVALLDKNIDVHVQEAVLCALVVLTLAAPENETMVVAATPGALECLTKCLALDGSPPIQQWAAAVIRNCCSFAGETTNKVRSFPGLMGALVALLDKDIDLHVHEAVLLALANLTNGAAGNETLVVATPGALECLTKCLALDGSPAIQLGAAILIKNCLCFEGETKNKVRSFPGLVGVLVSLLEKAIHPIVREAVLQALQNVTWGASDS